MENYIQCIGGIGWNRIQLQHFDGGVQRFRSVLFLHQGWDGIVRIGM